MKSASEICGYLQSSAEIGRRAGLLAHKMPPMMNFESSSRRRTLRLGLATSVAIHLLVLFYPVQEKSGPPAGQTRLVARLESPKSAPVEPSPPSVQSKPTQTLRSKPQRRVIATDKSRATAPPWTVAQKAEMDGFLNELAEQAKNVPKPSLAQRSMAMAREAGRQLAREDAAGDALLELRPNGPPVNPFSLEIYLDGLVRRLNRSAGFVNKERKTQGVQTAAVQFRLNPDGSLKSFVVLNAADQAEEIAFIKAVIERSTPFSPFPPEIDLAARSLGVTICIRPGRNSEPGFSRMKGSRCV
jgi:hypothetical protein